jgi:hypothetical protein
LMAEQLPEGWPERPQGFYQDWTVFSRTAVEELLRSADVPGPLLASLLLASGAVLGSGVVLALLDTNRDLLERKEKEWGIPGLATIVVIGGSVMGGALGGAMGAKLARMLASGSDEEIVEAHKARLIQCHRDFEELERDVQAGQLEAYRRQAEVERLFREITVLETLGE